MRHLLNTYQFMRHLPILNVSIMGYILHYVFLWEGREEGMKGGGRRHDVLSAF